MALMINLDVIFYALLGGVLPALVWLTFWLREDYRNPEPRRLVLKTFLFGMGAVILVLPFQKAVDMLLPGMGSVAVIIWIVLEETFKFGAAYVSGIRSADDNEPIDPIVYMITAALGFVALENSLFLLGPLVGEQIVNSVITGNLRFIGASLLHVVSSGIVGVFLAFSFYQSKRKRFLLTTMALILAVIFHSAFNFTILYWHDTGTLFAFTFVWIGVILMLLAFEKAKTIARP